MILEAYNNTALPLDDRGNDTPLKSLLGALQSEKFVVICLTILKLRNDRSTTRGRQYSEKGACLGAITFLVSTAGISLIWLCGTAEQKRQPTYDDKPMVCAVFYRALAKAYNDTGDEAISDRYMAKSNVLYEQAVANVLAVGGTREQARKATQNFANIIEELASSKPEALPSLVAMCRREYP
ncbi:hypothetical protein AMK01_PC00162 (plasmid) [Rhizobium sp. N6212]|nr:hypothetical protein AMK01_PC00162 [Rhizobium sp. N6212]ANL00628.1 hypothetical protein AMK00_PC00162 [Rhizobium sp. N621]ANL06749.1 hypothetical protein AMJ99_PC00162 [Rhizobium esperanzae]ANL12920.1 hypothetical protein AMJ98_PD00162 [Rhizobium sp. N1341]ANL24905.1 hypothetical protein AMJ96_PC00162 [Rhizobium sp. N113]ANM37593.1 hypothetical protein AMK04_PC00162 [Rhizobium sp. N871]ANM43743.1 hypothetical protein AMK03_PD00162 [Rhizobium sp. N741]